MVEYADIERAYNEAIMDTEGPNAGVIGGSALMALSGGKHGKPGHVYFLTHGSIQDITAEVIAMEEGD